MEVCVYFISEYFLSSCFLAVSLIFFFFKLIVSLKCCFSYQAIIEQAIKNAKSVDEIAQLEQALATGKLPPSLQHLAAGSAPAAANGGGDKMATD